MFWSLLIIIIFGLSIVTPIFFVLAKRKGWIVQIQILFIRSNKHAQTSMITQSTSQNNMFSTCKPDVYIWWNFVHSLSVLHLGGKNKPHCSSTQSEWNRCKSIPFLEDTTERWPPPKIYTNTVKPSYKTSL